jgi:hypothetical protein
VQEETHRRRDAGILQVTERDQLALTWIAEQYCISYDQLQRLLALLSPATPKRPDRVAPSTAQNALERWLQLGYIDVPQKVVREHSTYVWLSRKGLKELDLPYAYYQPKPRTVRHFYAVNAIRLHLQRYPLSAEWVAGRTLHMRTERRPLPDAEFQMHGAAIAAIQVIEQHRLLTISIEDELTTMLSLIERYHRLWYFVHAQALEPLQAAIREHDAKAALPDEQLSSHVVWYTLDAQEITQ